MFKTSICLLFLTAIVNVAAAQNCTAKVNVTQTAKDQDAYGATFKYRIEATSDASSAVVHFKIRRTYDINGSHYSQSEPWSVVTQGGQADDTGELRDSSSPRQIQWSVEDILCKRTDTANAESNPLAANAPDGIDGDANKSGDGFAFKCTKGSNPGGSLVREGPDFDITADGNGQPKLIGVFWGMTFRIRYFKDYDSLMLIVGQPEGLRAAATAVGAAAQISVIQNHIQHSLSCVRYM